MSALPPINVSPQATTASPSVSIAAPVYQPAPEAVGKSDGAGQNLFMDLMARANDDQLRSEAAIQDLVTGKSQDVQQVVMEVVKAEMSFQIFMEVRNQIVDSYNELMRMQF